MEPNVMEPMIHVISTTNMDKRSLEWLARRERKTTGEPFRNIPPVLEVSVDRNVPWR
jgi:hypothetical protein